MRVDISFKHMERTSLIDNALDKNIKKIERRLKLFKDQESVHFSFHMEKNPHRNDYFCWANLYMPYKVIKASEHKQTPTLAINFCFSALTKQLDKVKHRIESYLRKKS